MLGSVPIVELGNFLLIGGLIFYGFSFFAQYHATGKRAKNITSLRTASRLGPARAVA